MTKFSLALGVGRREPVSRVIEVARLAEALGFHGLWLQDNPLMTKDAYMVLALIAANTSRLTLAPGVTSPAVRHVSVVVNSIATLDQISDGRAVLGVGMGGPALLRPLGVPGRVDDFRESLARIQTLMAGQEVVGPPPMRFRIGSLQRRLPVYVAARGPRMLGVTGELADGVLLSGVAQKASYLKKLEQLRQGADRAGRGLDQIKLNLLVNLSLDSDAERAVAAVKPYAASQALEAFGQPDGDIPARFGPVVEEIRRRHDPTKHLSADAPELAAVTTELAQHVAIAGDERECRSRLEAILTLEPDEVTFTLGASGREERLRTLANFVRWYGGAEAGS